MAHSYHHAVSSARKWGGTPDDYLLLHSWMDSSKLVLADFRHRALLHHAEGCWQAERLFGVTITNSAGRVVPVRAIAEQHILEDLGRIPSFADWVRCIRPEPWMGRAGSMPTDDSGTQRCDQHPAAEETTAFLTRALRSIHQDGAGVATQHPAVGGGYAWHAGPVALNGQAVSDLIGAGWLAHDREAGTVRIDAPVSEKLPLG